jgi:D-amino-acid dehydrogenase
MKNTATVVLGAGMVGLGTALALQQRGHAVTLVDRKRPGRETSYGNAGIIQREAVEPYAFPRDLSTLLRVATGRSNDAHYHLGALWSLLPPLARYWHASAPRRYAPIADAYGKLIAQSIEAHRPLIADAGADALVSRNGWRQAYRDPAGFEAAAAAARQLAQRTGLDAVVLDSAALSVAEPALRLPLAGAIHWRDPWSISDPGELVARYAQLFVRRGGRFAHGDASTLRQRGSGWSVQTDGGPVEAERMVVALGPWADTLTRQLGYRLPLFVKRGYHRHYATPVRLNAPMLDVAHGVMLAPMSLGLRLTTGAEFARIDAPATPVQLRHAERSTQALIDLGAPVEAVPWLGARPCTADMKPVIGPAPRHAGLWFNFGHSHQGFTLGPATGRLLAEMMDGETPFTDPTPYLPSRFGS